MRTIGLAGGSMVRVRDGKVLAVGPRSAHLAGLAYSCFAEQQGDYSAKMVQPLPNDPPDYLIAANADERLALTMTCAANAAGTVPAGDYALGDGALAGQLFAEVLHSTPLVAAEAVLSAGCAQAVHTIESLLEDYELRREHVTLIGGGGGAGAVVPFTGRMMSLPWRIAENAPVISAIGVALALVRDVVERTIPNPSKEDLLRVRQEAVEAVVRVGANPQTVEVQVEVDTQHQLVRATATGATELRTRDLAVSQVDPLAQREAAARSLGVETGSVSEPARTPYYAAVTCTREIKKLFGLMRTSRMPLRLVDREGIIRLQLAHGAAEALPVARAIPRLREMMAAQTQYSDGGERLPSVFLVAGPRIFNLSGLLTAEHVLSLAEAELQRLPDDEAVLLLVGEQ